MRQNSWPEMTMEEHADIILEALYDYRRWFAENAEAFKENLDEYESDRIQRIDNAIKYIRGE